MQAEAALTLVAPTDQARLGLQLVLAPVPGLVLVLVLVLAPVPGLERGVGWA